MGWRVSLPLTSCSVKVRNVMYPTVFIVGMEVLFNLCLQFHAYYYMLRRGPNSESVALVLMAETFDWHVQSMCQLSSCVRACLCPLIRLTH